MAEITGSVKTAVPGVRSIPASEKFTAKRIDHYTIGAAGQEFRVTSYRESGDPVPEPGEEITGDLGELDKWDKDRLKFRVSRDGASSSAGAGGASAGGTPPLALPAPSPALPLEERRRWLAYQTAGLYAIARALNRDNDVELDVEDLVPVANAFMRAASDQTAPFSDVPIDLAGVPGEPEPAGETPPPDHQPGIGG